jgi:hypothetical protein
VRACIRLGHLPKLWKAAKGVVPTKPGKPDYSNVRSYRVISLRDVFSRLVECTAAHLIADHLERRKGRGVHDGQFGCRKRRSCVDAMAVLMNGTQQSWEGKKVVGALFMHVNLAFNNVSKAQLGRRMEALELELDHIWWTGSFMSDRQVKLVLGRRWSRQTRWTPGSQGSPAAPVVFITCQIFLTRFFDEVEKAVSGIKGLSFVEDIAWWAEGKDGQQRRRF